jgi:hypothetical protein
MVKLTKRKGFNFFRSYYDVYNELSDKDKIQFIDALLDRQFLGVKPTKLIGMAKFAYISQTNSIDSQVKGFQDKTGIILNPSKGGSNAPTVGGTDAPTAQVEEKGKGKGKGEHLIPSLTDVINYFKEKGYTEESAKKAFNYYQQSVTGSQNYWRDGKGNTIKNWKQKMIGVWFKPENELPKPKESTTFTERQYAELRKSKPTS